VVRSAVVAEGFEGEETFRDILEEILNEACEEAGICFSGSDEEDHLRLKCKSLQVARPMKIGATCCQSHGEGSPWPLPSR